MNAPLAEKAKRMPRRGGYPAGGRGEKPTSARGPKVIGLARNGDRLAPESVIGLGRNMQLCEQLDPLSALKGEGWG